MDKCNTYSSCSEMRVLNSFGMPVRKLSSKSLDGSEYEKERRKNVLLMCFYNWQNNLHLQDL